MTRYVETIQDPECSTCVHCQTYVLIPEPEHQPWCPQSTNVYVITERDLSEGMRCGCGHEFGLRESYTVIDSSVVCLGCAATEVAA